MGVRLLNLDQRQNPELWPKCRQEMALNTQKRPDQNPERKLFGSHFAEWAAQINVSSNQAKD